MAKAEIILKDGSRMNIDGTPEEIIQIKNKLENHPKGDLSKVGKDMKDDSSILSNGPLGRIMELVQEGFFKEKRTITDIKDRLEEKAIFYDSTSLSPSLLRLINKKMIRRVKEENQWRYVNP
jgi:hypothetical protein